MNTNNDAQCPVCGYYCVGKGGDGCIDKPTLCGLDAAPQAPGRKDKEMTTQHDERAELIKRLRVAAKTVPCFDVHLFEEAAALLAADAQAGGEAMARVVGGNTPGSTPWVRWQCLPYPKDGTLLYTHPQPQAVAHGWKPIETAPKDGTVILVTDTFTYRNDPEEKPHHVYRAVRWNEEGYGWEIYNDGEIIDQDGPTFWMPLPAEPGAMLSASPAAPAAAQVAFPDALRIALEDLDSTEPIGPTTEAVIDAAQRWYLAAPKAAQVAQPLTEDDIFRIRREAQCMTLAFARAIEAAHGIGKDQGPTQR